MTKRTIIIRFSVDKAGRQRAHYWGLAKRWLPITISAAEVALSTGYGVLDKPLDSLTVQA